MLKEDILKGKEGGKIAGLITTTSKTLEQSNKVLEGNEEVLPASYNDCKKAISKEFKLDIKSDWEVKLNKWLMGKVGEYMEKRGIDEMEAVQLLFKKLQKVLPRVYNNFLVHGSIDKAGTLKGTSDKDAEMTLYLLDFIKWNGDNSINQNLSFSSHGTRHSGYTHFDTGKANGVELENEDTKFLRTLVIDHHPDGPPSSFYILYTLLKKTGFIRKNQTEQLDRIADFMNIIDSYGHQATTLVYPDKSHNTLLGMYRTIPASVIFQLFKESIDPTKVGSVDMKYINNYSVKQRKDLTSKSIKQFEELKEKEQLISTKFGDFILDIGDNLSNGGEVVTYNKSGLIKIFPNGSVYVFHYNGLPKDLLSKGINVRGKIFVSEMKYIDPKEIIYTFGIRDQKLIDKINNFYKDIKEGSEDENIKEQKELLIPHKEKRKIEEKKKREAELQKYINKYVSKAGEIPYDNLEESKKYDVFITGINGKLIFVNCYGNQGVIKLETKEQGKQYELFTTISVELLEKTIINGNRRLSFGL